MKLGHNLIEDNNVTDFDQPNTISSNTLNVGSKKINTNRKNNDSSNVQNQKIIDDIKMLESLTDNGIYGNNSNQSVMDLDTEEHVHNKDSIYLRNSDGNYVVLTQQSVYSFIHSICEHLKIRHLSVEKITNNVYPKLKTQNSLDEFENLIISCATEMAIEHYDYPKIATYLLIHKLHENTYDDYMVVVEQLRSNINKKGKRAPIVSKSFEQYVIKYSKEINAALDYDRDFDLSIFGYRTLEKAYLKKKIGGKIIERPQHLYMRVAIALHYRTDRLDRIIETYDLLSQGYFTHATPTLFNAGTTHEQLSSCFLLGIEDDMESIGECWKDCAVISKYAGGIGINVTNIRVDGAYIHSTQGIASGLRLLTVFNQIARYADQGGKRAGSIAIYIEPWHGDIFFFLDLKKNTGAETERARDLFLGLMINDIFMKRVEEDGVWSLMCPSECPDLLNKYGTEFTEIYERYESQGKFIKQIKARDLWFKIMESQIESGVPYILYKDSCNYKSNQINIGVINGSNLCVSGDTQILTDKGYTNIASVVNQDVNVWNGHEFSNVTVKKTGTGQELLEVKFSNGSVLKCTPYHKFYIQQDDKIVETKASELKITDKIISCNFPTLDGSEQNNMGTYRLGYQIYDLMMRENKSLYVPTNDSLDAKLEWLTGLIERMGKMSQTELEFDITDDLNRYWVRDFWNEVKYMLQTLGCNPRIHDSPYKYIYDTFQISAKDCLNLWNLGLKNKINDSYFFRKFSNMVNSKDPHQFELISIVSVNQLETREDTYCFNEPHRHMGVFNGVITGNCAEILEVSTSKEYSVCNLSSICLPKFVEYDENGLPFINYKKLYHVSGVNCRNLNNIIDINFYPVDKTKFSNFRDRPIGIGIQGLADVFAMFKTAFDSDIARDINKKIFETIYFGALTESNVMAVEQGVYETFPGSPFSKGIFQFEMWGLSEKDLSGMWDWTDLRQKILTSGLRNSLLTTCMPTASTSQIRGNNECHEPYTANIYSRSTLAGDFYVINNYLMKDLMDMGLWNQDVIDLIKYYEGSIQNIPSIPDNIKHIYRTVWEIPVKSLIEMSADRGAFIDQTQSFNIFIAEPTFPKITSCLFYGWKKGLKTGMYYLRSKPASEANKFGIDIEKIKDIESKHNIQQSVLDNLMSDFTDVKIIDVDTSQFSNNKVCKIGKNLATGESCLMCGS